MLKKVFHSKLIFPVLGLILAAGLGFMEYFHDFFLTGKVKPGFFITPLIVVFLIALVDSILLSLLSGEDRNAGKSSFSGKVSGVIYYLVLFCSGLLTIYLIRSLYIFVGLDFKVSALFQIGFKEITWFILFVNIFISYLLFSLFIYRKIDKLDLSLKDKISIVIVILLIFSIGSYLFHSLYFVIPILLSFLIYVFVLDIYMDKKSLSSTWIFTFMILTAGFTALILYSAYADTGYDKRAGLLKKSIFLPDRAHEKLLYGGEIGLFDEDSIFIEETSFSKKEFLDIVNNGFYNISNTLYFNAGTGDYIRLIDKTNKKYNVKYLYNRRPGIEVKRIIFHGDRILSNNTSYETIPVPNDFMSDTSKINEYVVDGISYLKYRFDNKLFVVNIEKIPSILLPFSLFSMLFVLTGVFLFFISIINSKLKFLPKIVEISFDGITSLRDRIQFSIIGLVVVSFFVLGLITFYYIINFSEENQERYAVEYTENAVGKGGLSNIERKDILDKLLYLEKRDNTNFFLYDKNGNLVDDKRRKLNWNTGVPFQKLSKQVMNFENPKKRVFKNKNLLYSIVPVLASNAQLFVVGYFTNSNSFVEASEILSNFLNVYVLLFLIAGAIAIALANSISKPVEILGDKLEILDLSERNELLKWEKQDEIGKLINIYNNTVKKLEESAKIITKIERDSAWREMAKQVAHEIKNPLTPLKLNIQYMQGIVESAPERAADMVKQLAPGLIEQINNLDKIASEFADFAKMPKASNEKVRLNEIVKAVHDFFRKREDLDIQLYVPINDLIVFADKNHLVSILNNILKNAIQAIPTEKEGKIVIELYRKDNDAIVKITDNGTGIPEEMVSKVFSPNFTTKNSGTGLGLAISTNMIQAFNGKIYFETEVGKGTSFFVEIPLMRIQDNYPEQKRVFLDD